MYKYILKRRCAVVIAKSIFVGKMGFSLLQFLPIAFTHATIDPFFAYMTGSFECLVWMMIINGQVGGSSVGVVAGVGGGDDDGNGKSEYFGHRTK